MGGMRATATNRPKACLGNRHIVGLNRGTLVLKPPKQGGGPLDWTEDFIVHELTHARQAHLLRENPDWKVTRGDHRDMGWYAAVAEACPNYLGFELPPSIWPQGPRKKDGRLTEVEMTHWPESIRKLALLDDPRLPLRSRVHVRRFMAEAAEWS